LPESFSAFGALNVLSNRPVNSGETDEYDHEMHQAVSVQKSRQEEDGSEKRSGVGEGAISKQLAPLLDVFVYGDKFGSYTTGPLPSACSSHSFFAEKACGMKIFTRGVDTDITCAWAILDRAGTFIACDEMSFVELN
jgi:hypothetical protein